MRDLNKPEPIDNMQQAYKLVAKARKAGILPAQPCQECGATKNIHGHHCDYDKPLEIMWLCAKHHAQRHRLYGEGKNKTIPPVICPYCDNGAKLIDSKDYYSNGKSYGMMYLCKPCDATCGVHKTSNKPLGNLANKELRKLRREAHSLFDPLWQAKIRKDGCSKTKARRAGYKWLAGLLQLRPEHCHISWFSNEICKLAIKELSKFSRVYNK